MVHRCQWGVRVGGDTTAVFAPNDAQTLGVPAFGGTLPGPAAFDVNGGFGGGQFGYNWQPSKNWVVGFETDFDWSDIRGSGSSGLVFPAGLALIPGTMNPDRKVEWFGTVRGRVGFLPTDALLIYGTGGFAYGRVKENVSLNGAAGANIVGIGTGFVCTTSTNCFVGSSSRTGTGWTAGGGVEYAIWNNLSVKAEYLYVNLGGGDNFNVVAQSTGGPVTPSSFTTGFGRTEFHTIRGGLNWKFY